jgi:DNA-binding GntR family transcriptional regulator
VSFVVGRDAPLEDHRRILDACRERAVALAVRRLERHIERTQSALQAERVRSATRIGRRHAG